MTRRLRRDCPVRRHCSRPWRFVLPPSFWHCPRHIAMPTYSKFAISKIAHRRLRHANSPSATSPPKATFFGRSTASLSNKWSTRRILRKRKRRLSAFSLTQERSRPTATCQIGCALSNTLSNTKFIPRRAGWNCAHCRRPAVIFDELPYRARFIETCAYSKSFM